MEKHPKSLRIYFTTEMWERYGFYAVQSLLALYLALHFKWPDKEIYSLVGSFTALTYLSPLVGGWIADKLIGQKRAILLGAIVLFLSYCMLSLIDNSLALTSSLAGVAVGTGLLKPNISSLLGNEYPVGSTKRESGFTIFYMGITTGIILGTTLPSKFSEYFGWSASFTSASIGLIIAFVVFLFGIHQYKIKDY
ncbi:TPA: MFS transporter, partial [Legionella pneumophila]|nr:MFS transporter [Legionella pneumophila]